MTIGAQVVLRRVHHPDPANDAAGAYRRRAGDFLDGAGVAAAGVAAGAAGASAGGGGVAFVAAGGAVVVVVGVGLRKGSPNVFVCRKRPP
jgi:hypothetical protein